MLYIDKTPLELEELTGEVLIGTVVHSSDGHRIGMVKRICGADIAGYAVVSIDPASSLRQNAVAIPMREIRFCRNELGSLSATAQWTQHDIGLLPEFDRN